VGIGISSPRAPLHIQPSGGASDDFNLLVSQYRPNIVLEDITVSSTDFQLFVDGDDLQFRYGDASTDTKLANEAMRISNGNVGIGTSSPDADLTISSGGGEMIHLISSHTNKAHIEAEAGNGSMWRLGTVDSNPDVRLEAMDATGEIKFLTGGSNERMRIDSSGNLLVATTSTSIGDDGFRYNASSGWLGVTRNAGQCLYLNRRTTDGSILDFRKDNSTVGAIGVEGGSPYFGRNVSSVGVAIKCGSGAVFAADGNNGSNADNTYDLGALTVRWDDVYATNGTIQTSDRNEKQDIEELSDAEQRVAVVAKGLMRKFRWKSAVAEKGDNARTHFGIIAQDLQDAFTAEGLDAGDYAMFISNTWWEKEITVDAVEADEENGIQAKDAYTYIDTKEEATEGYTEKTRLGVRYNQLLAFIISAI